MQPDGTDKELLRACAGMCAQVLMATNRPDTLDPALLRPGRLDRKARLTWHTACGVHQCIMMQPSPK